MRFGFMASSRQGARLVAGIPYGMPVRHGRIKPLGEREVTMCDSKTRAGTECRIPPVFWVHVRVVPQTHPLPDGTTFTETDPAGRGCTTCVSHLAAKVRELMALEIRFPGAVVTVRTL
jgi:hypothetical protein